MQLLTRSGQQTWPLHILLWERFTHLPIFGGCVRRGMFVLVRSASKRGSGSSWSCHELGEIMLLPTDAASFVLFQFCFLTRSAALREVWSVSMVFLYACFMHHHHCMGSCYLHPGQHTDLFGDHRWTWSFIPLGKDILATSKYFIINNMLFNGYLIQLPFSFQLSHQLCEPS